MDEEINYELGEHNLDIPDDLSFVDGLLKARGLEAGPQTRSGILDLIYTLARDKLVEAQTFAQLANRTTVTVEDMQMMMLRKTRKLRKSKTPSARSMKLIAKKVSQDYLPDPRSEEGSMLPTWRNCQVGVMAELAGELKMKTPVAPPAATSDADILTSIAEVFFT
ncbi:uncharacterized protein LOC119555883 [Drosophila subpulchrella]|uniref:uncharacterized protein LOC119555883 n=1 Tax=Drosophila subpulchrella TaxID=1486046 RepID=UPI0018A14E3C|nr:uncharacterized protein LOC119555883 [Drosophila subpulchrella]